MPLRKSRAAVVQRYEEILRKTCAMCASETLAALKFVLSFQPRGKKLLNAVSKLLRVRSEENHQNSCAIFQFSGYWNMFKAYFIPFIRVNQL